MSRKKIITIPPEKVDIFKAFPDFGIWATLRDNSIIFKHMDDEGNMGSCEHTEPLSKVDDPELLQALTQTFGVTHV